MSDEYSDEPQPELVEGAPVPQDMLPERILLASEVVQASLSGFEVAGVVLTLTKRDEDDLNPEGLVLICTREDALDLATKLRAVAPTLKTMQSQLEARSIPTSKESNDNG